jgi:alkylhydroperoxidase family enzyme
MSEADVAALRAAGLDDKEILSVIHIAGYFNYLNRVADGAGIDLEDFMPRRHP